MKLNLKIPQKSKKKREEDKSLGTLEDMADPKYLPEKRAQAKKADALEGYYEMLETQISSLAMKVVKMDINRATIIHHPESDDFFIGTTADLRNDPTLVEIGTAKDLIEKLGLIQALNTKTPNESKKHIDKLRIAINNASNELFQAQQYARDHIDK